MGSCALRWAKSECQGRVEGASAERGMEPGALQADRIISL